MNYILFDDNQRTKLLPLVFTRPVADIRIGILTIREKWEWYLKATTSSLTQDYLSKKYPLVKGNDNLLINGSVVPSAELLKLIWSLKPGEQLTKDDFIIAKRVGKEGVENDAGLEAITVQAEIDVLKIENTWDIFAKNEQAIRDDFQLLTDGRKSAPLSKTSFFRGDKQDLFIEEGSDIEFAYINTESGPVYIGKNAVVMEGGKIRGPFAMCENAQVKMDAKIYGPTTLGPFVKVGGEVNNSVFFGYSNKAHDGFLGNSVIGEWCNIGADTNNSNLKNTYDFIRLWSYAEQTFVQTNLQFCGMIMGDHSKTAINAMFNTGTVVGVSCNLFGSGFQRNFIPSFSWGGPHHMIGFKLAKAFDVATAVMKRRNKEFNQIEKEILTHIYNETLK